MTSDLATENVLLRAEIASLRAEIAQLRAPPLAVLLGREMGQNFSAAEVMAKAEHQAREAEDEGRAIPELAAALQAEGIGNARSLAKWLPNNGFEIVAHCGGSGIWAPKAPDII